MVVRGVVQRFDDLGYGSNGDAEWLALIRALDVARSLGLCDFTLLGDAASVIDRANRALADPSGLAGHAAVFAAIAAGGPRPRLRWIKRTQNLAGIALTARHSR